MRVTVYFVNRQLSACTAFIFATILHGLFVHGTVITQTTDGASSMQNTVLQIYSATFSSKWYQRLSKYDKVRAKIKRSIFYWDTVL